MNIEIGSEFGLEEYGIQPSSLFTDMGADTHWLMSGRCAIYYILKEISTRDKKKTAYLPAYICHTVIDPFLKSNYQLIYYDVNESLKPVFDNAVMGNLSVVVIIDYFGFTNENSAFIKACQQQDIIVIEDMSHSIFSKQPSAEADYAIGSLRKWLGIPGGGWALSMGEAFTTQTTDPNLTYIQYRAEALRLKKAYMDNHDETLKTASMELFSRAEEWLEHGFDLYGEDSLSDQIAANFPLQTIKQRRRRNYTVLQQGLHNSKHIKVIFPELPNTVCPMFFPIYTDNRDYLKSKLIANRIYPPVHWPIAAAINIARFPQARQVYASILSLPCDQRYDDDDMQRIVEVINPECL